MSEWREERIEDLCVRVTSGGTPSRARPEYYCDPPDGLPWVKSQELLGRAIADTSEHISEAGLRGSSAKLLSTGSVLMAMYGANVGQMGYLAVEATVNQAICAMITDPAVTDARFLYYALLDARQNLIAKAQGAAQQNLSQQLIKPFRLRVPDIEVQRNIGATLRALDNLIENNRRRVEVLKEMARAIYREWFVHFRYPGYESVDSVASILGPIPRGWTAGRLRELAIVTSGKRPPTRHNQPSPGAQVPVIGASSVMAFTERPLTQGRLLITGRVGTHGVVQRFSDPVWPSDNTLVLTAPSYEYTYQVMLGIDYRSLNRGAAQPLLTQRDLSSAPAVVPDGVSLQKFERVAGTLMASVDLLERQSANLARLRDRLLPKLVSGQIDVSSLELDAAVEGAVG